MAGLFSSFCYLLRRSRPGAAIARIVLTGVALALFLPLLVLAQVPTLTALSPFIGVPGSTIALTGTNLTGTTTITFTGAAGTKTVTTGFTVASSTSITGVVVPAGAQSGPVKVTRPSGTSAVTIAAVFSRATSLATGDYHTVAVRADGSLWAWGYNSNGQLGQGDLTQQTSPSQVGTGTSWVSATAGGAHTVAVRADGSLWVWGNNANGQLGQGNTTQLTSPTRVGTGTTWVSAAAGDNHTVAVRTDGSLWAWGRNANGQLGQGNTTQLTSPTRVGTGTSWVSAAAGLGHTVAVRADGSLWVWGSNNFGQLGQGDLTQQTSPTQVGTGTSWVSAAAGAYHTVAVQSDGSLRAWGNNGNGQLGDGSTTQRTSPVQVGTGTSWVSAAAGGAHTAGEQSCYAVWAWGFNGRGQVGDGSTPDRISPVQVYNPAPALLAFVPASATAGATVAVTGTGLSGLTALTVNGADAFASISNTTATGFSFVVPGGATATGSTTVSNNCGAASSTGFTVILAPALTSLLPTSGSVGTSITLTGTNFTGATAVRFNGTAATTFAVTNATTATATVPTGATTGNVTITTAAGTSNGISFTVVSPPVIQVVAGSISVSAGDVVTVNGINLANASALFVGGVAATITANTATSIVFTVPLTVPGGTVYFSVTTPAGTFNAATTTQGPFLQIQPRITGFSPTAAVTGSTITFTGTGFSASTLTEIQTGTCNPVLNLTIVSASQATGVLHPFACSGPVNYRQSTNSPATGTFTVLPAVLSFTPASGPVGSPVIIAVSGNPNFSDSQLSFAFNGTAVTSFTRTGLSEYRLTVPAGASSGLIGFTTPGGTAASATSFTTVPNQAPTALALSNASIAENNAANATIGTLTTTDPDAGDTFAYALVAGIGSADNASFNLSGNILRLTAPADYETKNSYAIRLRTTDQGGTGLTFEQTFVVSISNVNEAPGLSAQTRAIAENSANGTAVGAVLAATDPDAGPSLSFAITGGNGTGAGAFAINNSGQLTVADVAQLDYETTPVFTLTVRVSDGSLSASTPITVDLTDVVEAVDLTVSSPATIPAGLYNNITVTGTGVATLSGAATVNGTFVVQTGGTLLTNCQALTGAGSFTLAAGATLGICDVNGISASGGTGAVRMSGVRSFSSDANYLYNRTLDQATGPGLPAQVRSLTTTNAQNLTLTQPVAIAQTLALAGSGNLTLNGHALVLLSSATGTALVVNSGTGVVNGTATVQRYIDGSLNPGLGYRHFSAPVSNTTVADLATAGFTPVLTQSYNSSATPGTTTPFPTVFGYDQSRLMTASNSNFLAFDKGFFVPLATDALIPGQGYAVNIGAAQLVDFVGTLGTGDRTVSLARNAGATATDAGWQLVGNPYPAPLDWSQVLAADRSGLDASMYVSESSSQYGGSYRSYVNSVGNPLIASSQGFFVRVSSGQTNGSLTFRNGHRLTSFADQVPVRRGAADTRPLVQLTLAGSGAADNLYVYAEAGATVGLDSQFDAVKLTNPSGLNLSSAATSGQRLAIDGRPAFTLATVLPLAVGVPAAGAYTLEAATIANLPAGLLAYLLDAQTGTATTLTVGTRYAFSVSAAQASVLGQGRFSVVFRVGGALATMPAQRAAAVGLYPNPARTATTLVLPAGAGPGAADVVNALGQVVRRFTLPTAETRLDLRGLATGVYVLRLSLDGQPVRKRLVIE